MVVLPQPGPNESTTRDPDRAAVLVRYTLLGAAINGFLPGAPESLDRGRRATVAADFLLRFHSN